MFPIKNLILHLSKGMTSTKELIIVLFSKHIQQQAYKQLTLPMLLKSSIRWSIGDCLTNPSIKMMMKRPKTPSTDRQPGQGYF